MAVDWSKRKHVVNVGDKFGAWEVIAVEVPNKYSYCLCKCGCCGSIKERAIQSLVNGKSTKCHSCSIQNDVTKHGQSYSREYSSWVSMKMRCYNPKETGYADYGGRGIKVCERWITSFDNFLADMGERPKNTSIDRIDVNGDYMPDNCRWATRGVQSRNKRNNHNLTYNGVTKTITDWAIEYNINVRTLTNRISTGMCVEDALLKPVKAREVC